MTSSADLELTDVTRAVGRGFGRIAIGALLGLALGLAVVLFAPARFHGRAMLLVRTEASVSSMAKAQLGPLGELAGGALGGALGGETPDRFKTEVALLRSRALLGDAVDSLQLQIRAGRVPAFLVGPIPPLEGRFAPRTIEVGEAGKVKVVDREDAIDDLEKRLDVEVIGGEIVEISYTARDSMTAALVPNLVAHRYMQRRQTVDRGLNQRRVEFLSSQSDSARLALSTAAAALREAQEAGQVNSLELTERAEVEGRIAVQVLLVEAEAERAALERLMAEVEGGDPRRLAGFPSLLRSPAVNELVVEMASLGTDRALLLADATPRAPRVIATDSAIAQLRAQLVPMARSYADALAGQRDEYLDALNASRGRSAALPRVAEGLLAREREVQALGRFLLAIEAQLLDARLAALGEGGDVRLVDTAVVPRRVSFPRRLPTLAIGLLAGLMVGTLAALSPLGRGPEGAEE